MADTATGPFPRASTWSGTNKPFRRLEAEPCAVARRSLHGLPALWQHIECQRVTVGVLIAFQYRHWRQHMPDAIIVEDVTLTRFAHREAIHFMFLIVGYDDFAAVNATAGQQMRGDILFPVFM